MTIGAIHGNPTYVNGSSGKAMKFDGVNDWAELTDFKVPQTFTISMKVNSYKTDGGQSFISKHTDTGDNILLLGYYGEGNHGRLRTDSETGGTKTTGYQNLVLVTKKISNTQSEMALYKDGKFLWKKTMD